jgi:uncharacterized protein
MPCRTDIMAAAKERADAFGLCNVLVATNSGASIRSARQAFGSGYRFFAVGNPASAHARGLVLHDGVSEETRRSLEAEGVTIVLQDRSLFQTPRLSFMGASLQEVVGNAGQGRFGAVSIAYNVLQLLSDGPRVCLEIALMAADSGDLPLDADCISIACPSSYCDLPNAAVVLRPARSEDVFKGALRIKDVTLRPTAADVWFGNGPLP